MGILDLLVSQIPFEVRRVSRFDEASLLNTESEWELNYPLVCLSFVSKVSSYPGMPGGTLALVCLFPVVGLCSALGVQDTGKGVSWSISIPSSSCSDWEGRLM
ncbi:unnamed protein product [Cochlearia groenlandica]